MNRRTAPRPPGARPGPTAGYLRSQLLFARVVPGGAARTVFPGSRGGRPSSPRGATPSLSVSSLRRVGSPPPSPAPPVR